MARNVQSFNGCPVHASFGVWRSIPSAKPKPFRNRTDENARDQFGEQRSMSPAEPCQLLAKQEFAFGKCAESAIGSAISNDLFTAENPHCVRIRENAKQNPRTTVG